MLSLVIIKHYKKVKYYHNHQFRVANTSVVHIITIVQFINQLIKTTFVIVNQSQKNLPYKIPIILMIVNCCLSLMSLKAGAEDTKSSQVTVDKEFTFDTRKLQQNDKLGY